MLGVLLMLIALLVTAIADKSIPTSTCPLNILILGERCLRDTIVSSRTYVSSPSDTITWTVDDATTTWISEVRVFDQLGKDTSATPHLRSGGPLFQDVEIEFVRQHPLVVVEVLVEIWGFALRSGEDVAYMSEDETDKEYDDEHGG